MSLLTVCLIAVALAMDAFAVSLSTGTTMKKMQVRHALRMAGFFGVFQAVMPIVGWSLGLAAAGFMQGFDHWVAFALLTGVGGKMVYEAIWGDVNEAKPKKEQNIYMLITLAFATSIDAAAVGITLSFLNIDIVQPAVIIGLITFVISLLGVYIGVKVGNFFGSKIEIFGGLVLIGIGIKILLEHTLFA